MIKNLKFMSFVTGAMLLVSQLANAQAIIRNPGEATGQLVYLTAQDLEKDGSAKYKALNAMSIPVFTEQPHALTVVAGTITLSEQNINSHVQLKAIARKNPNLDLSQEKDGINGVTLKGFKDGDWVKMVLVRGQAPKLTKATKKDAEVALQNNKNKLKPVTLKGDLQAKSIFKSTELSYQDADKVGAKAANYGELTKALNTASRTVTRPGYGIPFFYYQQFLNDNPIIKNMIIEVNSDPMMEDAENTAYRVGRLNAIQTLIRSEKAVVSDKLVDELISIFDKERSGNLPRAMKLRSSTNSEDLPEFNGAGLYDSYSYKPVNKKGVEKTLEKKREDLKETLRWVWSSVFNQRAYEERMAFRIPHDKVLMGIQVNPSFSTEELDGVVITKNVARNTEIKGDGVYIEAQRGDKHGVANPEAGVKPEQILVTIDSKNPLNTAAYKIHRLQKSNIADDKKTILPSDNPADVMKDEEIIDLVQLVKKAEAHFKPRLGKDKADFALDLEFKVDMNDTGARQVYIKQSRPYLD